MYVDNGFEYLQGRILDQGARQGERRMLREGATVRDKALALKDIFRALRNPRLLENQRQ